jgi:hypothetical protein
VTIWRRILSIAALPLATPEERVARLQRRANRISERVADAWAEYLAECRAAAPGAYDETEQHAYRRLLGRLAEQCTNLRAVEFELEFSKTRETLSPGAIDDQGKPLA